MSDTKKLTNEDRAIYEWQMWVPDFGDEGQEKLKNASVLVSRCGGLGSVVAYELAAAGIGHLVIAHRGNVKPSDLNRQLLMTHDWLGKPRVESAVRRLKELNPHIEIEGIAQNLSEDNADEIISKVDLVVDCAPLFEERFAMNRAAFAQNKPLVECAMYELEAQITTLVPRRTPCLRCLYPETPEGWKRQFPVFGAVSGAVACMGAMEAIKLIAGFGEPLLNRMLRFDLRSFSFHTFQIEKAQNCSICS